MRDLRGGRLVLLLLTFSGLCVAQDTNFPIGPQYLINYGSPLFLHPIATPSLSLSAPPATNPSAPAEEGTGEPSSAAVGGLKSRAAIDRIYWGVTPASTTAGEPSVEESNNSQAETATVGKSSEIELSSAGPSRPIPSSITDVGVTAMAGEQSDYGAPLGNIAAYWKANKPRTSRVFTNADAARLHAN